MKYDHVSLTKEELTKEVGDISSSEDGDLERPYWFISNGCGVGGCSKKAFPDKAGAWSFLGNNHARHRYALHLNGHAKHRMHMKDAMARAFDTNLTKVDCSYEDFEEREVDRKRLRRGLAEWEAQPVECTAAEDCQDDRGSSEDCQDDRGRSTGRDEARWSENELKDVFKEMATTMLRFPELISVMHSANATSDFDDIRS